jgi:TPR repeat protein
MDETVVGGPRLEPLDLDAARRRYERAADAGDSTALYSLGLLKPS